MAIHLKPEQELVIDQAIRAGLIQYPDDIVDVGVETIRRKLEVRQPLSPTLADHDWSSALHDWVRGHSSAAPPLPDEAMGRESIYGSRGL